jgi:hypothetical protein
MMKEMMSNPQTTQNKGLYTYMENKEPHGFPPKN